MGTSCPDEARSNLRAEIHCPFACRKSRPAVAPLLPPAPRHHVGRPPPPPRPPIRGRWNRGSRLHRNDRRRRLSRSDRRPGPCRNKLRYVTIFGDLTITGRSKKLRTELERYTIIGEQKLQLTDLLCTILAVLLRP